VGTAHCVCLCRRDCVVVVKKNKVHCCGDCPLCHGYCVGVGKKIEKTHFGVAGTAHCVVGMRIRSSYVFDCVTVSPNVTSVATSVTPFQCSDQVGPKRRLYISKNNSSYI